MDQKLARIPIDEVPPRARRSPVLILLAVLLLLLPLLYELGAVCAARWQSLYGPVRFVETPVIDALEQAVREARLEVESRILPIFSSLPWKTSKVIPLIIAWTALAALLLRSGHRT